MRESVCILGKFLHRHYEHKKFAETFLIFLEIFEFFSN